MIGVTNLPLLQAALRDASGGRLKVQIFHPPEVRFRVIAGIVKSLYGVKVPWGERSMAKKCDLARRIIQQR